MAIGIEIQPNAESFLKVLVAQLGSVLAAENLRQSAMRLPQIVTRAQDLELALSNVLQHLTGTMGFDYASVSLVDEVREVIEMERARNVPKGWRERTRFALDSDDILSKVFREKRTECNFGEWEPHFNEAIWSIYRQDRLARFWVPVVWKGACVAVFSGGCEKERGEVMLAKTRMEEIEVLGARYAELIAQSRQHCSLRDLTEEAMRLVGGDGASAHIEQDRTTILVAGTGWIDVEFLRIHKPRSGGLGALSLSEGRALSCSGQELKEKNSAVYEAGIRAIAVVPLVLSESVTGLIYVCHSAEAVEFTESDLRLLQMFALQAQAVLRSGLLLRSLSESAESTFTAWGLQFVSGTASEVTLPRLLGKLLAVFEGSKLALWRIERDRDAAVQLELIESLGGQIGVEATARASEVAVQSGESPASRVEAGQLWLRVQPFSGAAPNGVLYLRFDERRHEFDGQELRSLQNLGNTIAIRLAELEAGRPPYSNGWREAAAAVRDSESAVARVLREAMRQLNTPGSKTRVLLRYSGASRRWCQVHKDGTFGEPLLEGDTAQQLSGLLASQKMLPPKSSPLHALGEFGLAAIRDGENVLGAIQSAGAEDDRGWLAFHGPLVASLFRMADLNEASSVRVRTAHCLEDVSAGLAQDVGEELLMYRVLTGLTAGEGLGFSRAFWIPKNRQPLRSVVWIGKLSRAEADQTWDLINEEAESIKEDRFAWLLRRAGPQEDKQALELPSGGQSAIFDSLGDGKLRIVPSGQPDEWRNVLRDLMEQDARYPFVVTPVRRGSEIYGVVVTDNRYLWSESWIEPDVIEPLKAFAALATSRLEAEDRRMELLRIARDENSSRSLGLQYEDKLVLLHRILSHQLSEPMVLAEDELRYALNDPKLQHSRDSGRTIERIQFALGQLAHAQHVVVWGRILTQLDQPTFALSTLKATPFAELRVMVESAVGDYGFASKDKRFVPDQSLQVALQEPGGTVRIHTELFDQCLREVLRNAQKYGFKGGQVIVSAKLNRRKVTIFVASHGVVLRTADRRKCVRREWRSAEAQREAADGRGLGLWMVSQILKNHKGGVVILSDDKGATCIGLRVPFEMR